jgi:beta-mannanase
MSSARHSDSLVRTERLPLSPLLGALVWVIGCGGGGVGSNATSDAGDTADAIHTDAPRHDAAADAKAMRDSASHDVAVADSRREARGQDAIASSEAGDTGSVATSFLLGWYQGASCCSCSTNCGGPGNIDTFAAWLGSPITIGSDYAAIGSADAGAPSWENWEFPPWQSTGWQTWRMTHPSNQLVYAPGMGVVEDLTGGAAGSYDSYWKALGESLVAAGYPDAIIRIAHEFNGNWYWYQPQGMTTEFIGYWQHAVKAMRSASGQSFKFFWNPNLGVSSENGTPFDCEDAYPGDAYVDYIGPDTYDAAWGLYPMSGTIPQATYDQAWQSTLTQDHGLDWFVTFAAQHNKPLAVAEWGVWAEGSTYGGGDDPGYIQHMHDWFVANHVAFANYFDSGSDAIYPGSPYPQSLAAFKTAF